MTATIELSEADVEKAVEQYIKRQGYVPKSAASIQVHSRSDSCGMEVNYATASIEVEAEPKKSTTGINSLAHQIESVEKSNNGPYS